ncbi:glycosyltransferase family 4 protein [Thermobrachium celere]|uniref:Glycosyltransferase n=1 Tax=Thermobrachium celere DSM 8682 TaxID=941824 RepID=R7RPR5_9CLOT|nr:glycosyltransferase family 1 protein [Thermobrachium celere]CDF57225.1 Glycosyltransferase [Thermobrachium celere DSM 8682]
MKIGIDARAARWYRGTGIGTYTYQLIYNICRLDKINNYTFFLPNENNSDLDIPSNIKVNIIDDRSKDTFWEDVYIPNVISNTGIDVYLVPQNGIGLPSEKMCKFFITLHDVIPYKMPETVGPQYLDIYLKEVPQIIKRIDGIITVSNFSKKDISETLGFPEDKIYVTYLAAEEFYVPMDKEVCKNFVKRNYGIDEEFILYVGGFSPRKNIKGLIQAFALLKEKYKKPIKLVILGKKGRSYYDYRDLSYKLNLKDDVIFTGYVPVEELPIFYNAAKIFVYPSFYEGFGLPPLEAMACGTPTIASNKTSIPEILGEDTLYINPYDVDDIKEKMLLLLNDETLYFKMVLKSLKRSSMYSWKKTAVETIEILNS